MGLGVVFSLKYYISYKFFLPYPLRPYGGISLSALCYVYVCQGRKKRNAIYTILLIVQDPDARCGRELAAGTSWLTSWLTADGQLTLRRPVRQISDGRAGRGGRVGERAARREDVEERVEPVR